MNPTHSDQAARQRALAAHDSFIVQAPAGSGKTELLIQRFLVLLGQAANHPEEIIAITFTRKAAAEMRERILQALHYAATQPEPEAAHQQTTWRLAKAVLQKNQQQQWQLLDNPNRLRIQTIDALCASLNARIPTLSGCGAQPQIIEDANELYQEAAQRLITSLKEKPAWANALTQCLLHLDNRVYQLEALCMTMLSKREQWLRHIIPYQASPDALQLLLEESLANIAIEAMQTAAAMITPDLAKQLLPLASSAAYYFQENDPTQSICLLRGIHELPDTTLAEFTQWHALASLLLTQKGEWRRRITKANGFPAKTTAKDQMQALLSTLSDNENLRSALANLLECPPTEYTSTQWQAISAFMEILPILSAQLTLVFQERGCVDFIELNLAAKRALGSPEAPTELALYLDYQIQHLLVDEFQDTSILQFELLTQLVSGWQPQDGRTIFLVGDPMQSIYRFRNAEVGLFLRAKHHGIADIPLVFLQLTRNFRSQANVVHWINQHFATIFPATDNITSGAIPYTPATATQSATADKIQCVGVWTPDEEAAKVVELVQHYQQQSPTSSMAILVRSRTHLQHILPALHAAQIAFQAVDIEPLAHCMEIQDLLHLTRALLHLEDRIAWLSVLRAPWCGLKLADIHVIAQETTGIPLWDTLSESMTMARLSDDAKQRLQRVLPILTHSLNSLGRLPLAQWIEGTWLSLGGPATLTQPQALSNVNLFFKCLNELEQQTIAINTKVLTAKINKLYAKQQTTDQRLQIMTIHKAKGLEFDHVFIPQLQRKTNIDKNQLLMWLERPKDIGDPDLIFAPIKDCYAHDDAIYQYLRSVEKTKADLETARLFYVAATRAKKSIHLLTQLTLDEKNALKKPATGSFIDLLWPSYHAELKQHCSAAAAEIDVSDQVAWLAPTLQRLTTDWNLPLLESGFNPQPATAPPMITGQQQDLSDSFDSASARTVGTIVHQVLERIGNVGCEHWHASQLQQLQTQWPQQLRQQGIPIDEIPTHVTTITATIQQILTSERGRWILSGQHQAASCEYPLSTLLNNKLVNVVIDRTFIDNTQTRWIIDYKTATPHTDLAEFYQQQQQAYTKQLQQYRLIMQRYDNTPIRTALYFPLCDGWLEIEETIEV